MSTYESKNEIRDILWLIILKQDEDVFSKIEFNYTQYFNCQKLNFLKLNCCNNSRENNCTDII